MKRTLLFVALWSQALFAETGEHQNKYESVLTDSTKTTTELVSFMKKELNELSVSRSTISSDDFGEALAEFLTNDFKPDFEPLVEEGKYPHERKLKETFKKYKFDLLEGKEDEFNTDTVRILKEYLSHEYLVKREKISVNLKATVIENNIKALQKVNANYAKLLKDIEGIIKEKKSYYKILKDYSQPPKFLNGLNNAAVNYFEALIEQPVQECNSNFEQQSENLRQIIRATVSLQTAQGVFDEDEPTKVKILVPAIIAKSLKSLASNPSDCQIGLFYAVVSEFFSEVDKIKGLSERERALYFIEISIHYFTAKAVNESKSVSSKKQEDEVFSTNNIALKFLKFKIQNDGIKPKNYNDQMLTIYWMQVLFEFLSDEDFDIHSVRQMIE